MKSHLIAAVATLWVHGAYAQASEHVLLRFTGEKLTGSRPFSSLIANSNATVLYGTTSGAGTALGHGDGTVFSLSKMPKRWKQDILYAFRGTEDGSAPAAALTKGPSGSFFGTTYSGGAASAGKDVFQGGTVFQLLPSSGGTGWTETVLYKFPENSIHTPSGPLIPGKGGVLYGTAQLGGTAGYGGVFELKPPHKGGSAWTEATLYSFQGGTDGATPTAGLILDSGGALYGTTLQGGGGYNAVQCNGNAGNFTGCGTVFKLSPPAKAGEAWSEAVLYAFSGGADGALPYSTLVSDVDGTLYGTASAGGGNGSSDLSGVAFELAPPAGGQTTWTQSLLHSFQGYPIDGQVPMAGLTWGPDGALYGSTYQGGTLNFGAVFELSPPTGGETTWAETMLYSFLSGADGSMPAASVLLSPSGTILGTTLEGGGLGKFGSGNYGTVFAIVP